LMNSSASPVVMVAAISGSNANMTECLNTLPAWWV
jgi:hypothetical protein